MCDQKLTLEEVIEFDRLYENFKKKERFSYVADKFGWGTIMALMLSGAYNKYVLKDMLKEASNASTSRVPANFLINYPRHFVGQSNVSANAISPQRKRGNKGAAKQCSIS